MQVHVVLLGDVSRLILTDNSLVLQVYLVARDDNRCVLVLHLVDALNPVRDGFERFLVGHVKAEDDAIGLSVKLVSYVAELFLPCRIPNLNLNRSVVLLVVVAR